MSSQEIKVGNFVGWVRDSTGYLKVCDRCGRLIYMKRDYDGTWRPYASWVAGDAQQNEWLLHDCGVGIA